MNINENDLVKELVIRANNKNSWKERLDALNQIKDIDCPQRQDVVIRLAIHDKVFEVNKCAVKIAQELGLKKKGKPIYLTRKKPGYQHKDYEKVFQRIKIKADKHLTIDEIKERFRIINPEMYDVMAYEKRNKFNTWIKHIFGNLPKKEIEKI